MKHIKKNHLPQTGFTLVEMLVVVFIISIMSVTVIINWPYSVNLGAQAKQLVSDIRFTQALAMTHNARYYLVVNSSTNYAIKNSSGTAVTLSGGNTSVTLYTGITFGTLTNLPSSLIAFDGRGTPYTTSSSPGTALASTATIPLVSGSNTRTVSILPVTGNAN